MSLLPTGQNLCKLTADLSYSEGAHPCHWREEEGGGYKQISTVTSWVLEGQRNLGINSTQPGAPSLLKHLVPAIDSIDNGAECICLNEFADISSPLWSHSWTSGEELRIFCQWYVGAKAIWDVEHFMLNLGQVQVNQDGWSPKLELTLQACKCELWASIPNSVFSEVVLVTWNQPWWKYLYPEIGKCHKFTFLFSPWETFSCTPHTFVLTLHSRDFY